MARETASGGDGRGGGGGFLTHLAVNLKLAAVTQNQAMNALVFLYKQTLGIDLEGINAKRAKHTKRLPVVLTQEEAGELLKGVAGEAGLVCKLLYGCGLRVAEALALRIKDVDLKDGMVTVRSGKGDKDRVLTLPKALRQPLTEHRARIQQLHEAEVPYVFRIAAMGTPGMSNFSAPVKCYVR